MERNLTSRGVFMRYGYFDDARREYVITTPATPLPWINYLGSEDFLSMISNTGGGYCFYRDAKLMRLLQILPHGLNCQIAKLAFSHKAQTLQFLAFVLMLTILFLFRSIRAHMSMITAAAMPGRRSSEERCSRSGSE